MSTTVLDPTPALGTWSVLSAEEPEPALAPCRQRLAVVMFCVALAHDQWARRKSAIDQRMRVRWLARRVVGPERLDRPQIAPAEIADRAGAALRWAVR